MTTTLSQEKSGGNQKLVEFFEAGSILLRVVWGKSIAVFSATSNTQSLLCIYGGGFQRLLMFQPPNGMRNSKVVAVHVAESPG